MKRLIISLVVLLAIAAATSAGVLVWHFELYRSVSFVDTVEDPAALRYGLKSYTTVDAFLAWAEERSLSHQVERSENNGAPDLPPFQFTNVTLRAEAVGGPPGTLVVVFFNNRLMDLLLYPQAPDTYQAEVERELGRRFSPGQHLELTPNAVVWAGTDHEGKRYIGWGDKRLHDELSLWINRYT